MSGFVTIIGVPKKNKLYINDVELILRCWSCENKWPSTTRFLSIGDKVYCGECVEKAWSKIDPTPLATDSVAAQEHASSSDDNPQQSRSCDKEHED